MSEPLTCPVTEAEPLENTASGANGSGCPMAFPDATADSADAASAAVERKPRELPPYSHELDWPEGLEPFKVVDDGSQGDPYAHYQWMLENAPVLRCFTPQSDVWFITRYDDVRKGLRAPKVFSSQVVDPIPLTFLTLFDAPNHGRLRQVVAQAFTPKAVATFEERVRENANKYLDHMLAAGGGDAVDDYAIPLSMSTISALLDVPNPDFDKLKFWSDETFSYFGRLARNANGTGTDEQSAFAFFDFLKENLERLYAEDNQSVGGQIARMWKEGLLSEKEAKELCAFVFVAGHDTTTILIANAFRVFAENPELLARVRETPQDAELFMEELARYRGTVQRVSRITTEDVEIAGVTVPKGSVVRLMPAAANWDNRKYPQAEVFDIDRKPEGHLGFGHGVHSCLGAPLARLETTATIELLAQRLAAVALDPDKPIEFVRGNNLTNSGPEHLFVTMEKFNA